MKFPNSKYNNKASISNVGKGLLNRNLKVSKPNLDNDGFNSGRHNF